MTILKMSDAVFWGVAMFLVWILLIGILLMAGELLSRKLSMRQRDRLMKAAVWYGVLSMPILTARILYKATYLEVAGTDGEIYGVLTRRRRN